jgi:predicted O-methyltransferase YrrM
VKQKVDTEFESTLRQLATLGVTSGLHTDRERKMLWQIAKHAKEGAIVEIGSFEGYSTILLARAARKSGNKVTSVDPHTGRMCQSDENETPLVGDTWQRLNTNIHRAGVADTVQALKYYSEDAALTWQKPVALLFIDGSHRYEDVKKDLLVWRRHLIPGAIVVFHDIWISGVRRVIAENVLLSAAFGHFRFAPCCMLAANYGTKSNNLMQRTLWRLLLALRGIIEEQRTLRRVMRDLLRRVA